MDADYEENGNDPNEFSGRKRKGRSRFGHVIAQKKPVFNPGVLICREYQLCCLVYFKYQDLF